jgi:hypothetical protein
MQEPLSAEALSEVYTHIRSSFSDFHLFDYLISEKLKKVIHVCL